METTNKLAKVIRKIVKDEVRKEVRQVINEMVNKKPATTNDFHNGISRGVSLMDNIQPKRKKESPKKQYTKNQTLNDILNETANSMVPQREEEYPTMNNQTFTSGQAQAGLPDRNRLASMLGYGDMSQQAQQAQPTLAEMMPKTNVSGAPQRSQEVAPDVAKALTRDYSDLMKAMNKKKGK